MALHPILDRVRRASEDAYHQMLKVNLSRLMELEYDFADEDFENSSHHHHTGNIFGAPLTLEGICSVNQLMNFIRKKDNIVQEGIFRKSGSMLRQSELQLRIGSGETVVFSHYQFTVHDACCVLKKFISELPLPLLTTRDLFLDAIKLRDDACRINAIRLLILLLPCPNRIFLKDLLDLFAEVIAQREQNRMSAQSLATIFAQHLLIGSEMKPQRACQLLESTTKCLVYLIEHSKEIFEPPKGLMIDAQNYLDKREKQRLASDLVSTTNLQAISSTKYCVSNGQTAVDSKLYTQLQLAELMAHISQVPGGKKKKWMKKLNKENGFGSPLLTRHKEQQELIKDFKKSQKKQPMHRLGSAFKKILTPNSDKMLKNPSSPMGQPKSLSPKTSVWPLCEEASNKSSPNTRRSVSSVEISSPVSVVPVVVDHLMEQEKKSLSPPAAPVRNSSLQRSATTRTPRTVSPKKSLKRKTSISLKENQRPSTWSTKSLPMATQSFEPPRHSLSTPKFARTTPEAFCELDRLVRQRRVKLLTSKFESMSHPQSKLCPQNVNHMVEDEESEHTDEDYVCLNQVKVKKSLGISAKTTLSEILAHDPTVRISARKTRPHKSFIVEQHTAL